MNKIILTTLSLILTSTLATASTQNDVIFDNDILKKITLASVSSTLEEIDNLNKLSISEQSTITFDSKYKNTKSIKIANSKFPTVRTITLGE